MTHLLTSTILTLLIGASPAVTPIGQTPKTDEVTVSGCLQKDTSSEGLTLQTDTRAYDVIPNADLKRHVGHQIEVTGALAVDAKGGARLEVKSLRLLAASCSPAL